MPSESNAVEIQVTLEFKWSLRKLAKRYRNIRSDIQPVIEQLQAGSILGDPIPGIGYTVFKVRVKNSDVQRGKSGGYRFIYYFKTSTHILLVTLYSKSDQGDVSAKTIQQIVTNFEQQ